MKHITRAILSAAHSDWIFVIVFAGVFAAMLATVGTLEVPQ